MADDAKNLVSAGQQMREKFWNERDREEKLEALRSQIVQLFHMVQTCQDTVQALLQHQHSASGQLMAPLDGLESRSRMRHWTPPSLNNELPVAAEQRGIGAIHGR